MSLTDKDKRVIEAFTEKQPLDSRHLSTDGRRLDINGLGGRGVAEWKELGGGTGWRIILRDLGKKSQEPVHRYIVKITPKNWLESHSEFSRKQLSRAGMSNRGPVPKKKRARTVRKLPKYTPHVFRTKEESAQSYEALAAHERKIAQGYTDSANNDPAAKRHPSLRAEWRLEARKRLLRAKKAEQAAARMRSLGSSRDPAVRWDYRPAFPRSAGQAGGASPRRRGSVRAHAQSVKPDGSELVVRLVVSGGTRTVNGEAQMQRNRARPMLWEPSGQSIDAWLSGGIIRLIDEYGPRERVRAIDMIADLASAAATNYDEEHS
jgi:hypothetical protein